MTSGSEFDAYVLVHPEPFLDCDDTLLVPSMRECVDLIDDVVLFAAIGAHVARMAAGCAQRFLIDDGQIAERVDEWKDEPQWFSDTDPEQGKFEYVPGDGWTLVQADPFQVGRVTLPLADGSRVLVGGFARHDCVKRLVARLRRQGHTVVVDEGGTMPLTLEGYRDALADVPVPA